MSKYTIIGRTTPACKYCDKAKELLSTKDIEYDFIDLTGNEDALKIFKLSGETTIPVIFEGHEKIGGYDDLLIYLECF